LDARPCGCTRCEMERRTRDGVGVDTSDPLVFVGLACAITSCAGTSAALMVIKLSTEKEAHKPLCQRRLFFIGVVCNLVCEAGLTSAALALAPLSLISPVVGLSIVFGTVYAWVGLFGIKRERATPVEIVGLLIIVGGVFSTSIFGLASESLDDLHAISENLLWPLHLVYFFCGWGMALTWIALHIFDSLFIRIRPAKTHPVSAPLSGLASGFIASYSLTCFKLLMTCFRQVIVGNLVCFKYPFAWMSAFCILPLSGFQMYSLNLTMSAGGVNYALPWYTVSVIVLSAVVGGIVFDDFESMPDPGLFWVGVAVTLFGLLILAYFQTKRSKTSYKVGTESSAEPNSRRVQWDNSASTPGAKIERTKKPPPPKPQPPPGYVPDMRCYLCGLVLPCCKIALWQRLTSPRDVGEGNCSPGAEPEARCTSRRFGGY